MSTSVWVSSECHWLACLAGLKLGQDHQPGDPLTSDLV